MNKDLEKYVNGEVKYSHPINVLMDFNRPVDAYSELGEYLMSKFNDRLPMELSFYEQYFKTGQNPIAVIGRDMDQIYSSISITFLSSLICKEFLTITYGEPIYHNEFGEEFGEGFGGEWNEDIDDYDEPTIKFDHVSYFIEVEGVKMHIGCDHRGTRIEPLEGTDIEDFVKAIKKLMDIYCLHYNK